MQNINLRHLMAALEVGRRGSISQAASRVHLSQSAVTRGISNLERTLGTPLFSRTATGAIANERGESFLQRLSRGVQWLRAIEKVVANQATSVPRSLHRLLTMSQLRSLIAVVETGSYTRAAQRLGVSQPTVHRAVSDLEAICQKSFFTRSPQGVDASWQGRQVARYASLFLAEIEQAITEVREAQGDMSGRVTIGALPLSRSEIVPNAVLQLLAEYPNAQVRIIDGPYGEQLDGLLHGKIDFIVGALRDPSPSPDIVQETLFVDELSIVVRAGHGLAQATDVSVEALSNLEWVAPRERTPARDVFINLFERHGVAPPRHVIECGSLIATRKLLLESDRAAILPARQVRLEVASGLLAVSPLTLPGTTRRNIGIASRRDWLPTHAQAKCLALLRGDNFPED